MKTMQQAFLSLLHEAKDEFAVRRAIASFCQVTADAVYRWTKGTVPMGVIALRLRVFLTLAGVKVSEFEDLSARAQELSYLIAFNVLSVPDAARSLSVTNDTILTYLSGSTGVANQEEAIATLTQAHEIQLAEKREFWKKEIQQRVQIKMTRDIQSEETKIYPAEKLDALSSAVLHGVKSLHALLPLALAQLDSNGKKRLRMAIGHTNISDVRTQLQLLNLSDEAFANR